MPIDPSSIDAGNCYLTTTKQVRKVLEIDGDSVKFVPRGEKPTRDWEKGGWQVTTKNNFASEVDRQVTCDWDPAYPERDPSNSN